MTSTTPMRSYLGNIPGKSAPYTDRTGCPRCDATESERDSGSATMASKAAPQNLNLANHLIGISVIVILWISVIFYDCCRFWLTAALEVIFVQPKYGDRLLALPVEIRNQIWDPVCDRYGQICNAIKHHCKKCWTVRYLSLSQRSLALLRIGKAFNNELTRWFCHKFKVVTFCDNTCCYRYFKRRPSRRALQWTSTIICRQRHVGQAIADWAALDILQDLWRMNMKWVLTEREDAERREHAEWIVPGRT